MKHEIEIPGLPKGWRAVAYRQLRIHSIGRYVVGFTAQVVGWSL